MFPLHRLLPPRRHPLLLLEASRAGDVDRLVLRQSSRNDDDAASHSIDFRFGFVLSDFETTGFVFFHVRVFEC